MQTFITQLVGWIQLIAKRRKHILIPLLVGQLQLMSERGHHILITPLFGQLSAESKMTSNFYSTPLSEYKNPGGEPRMTLGPQVHERKEDRIAAGKKPTPNRRETLVKFGF